MYPNTEKNQTCDKAEGEVYLLMAIEMRDYVPHSYALGLRDPVKDAGQGYSWGRKDSVLE